MSNSSAKPTNPPIIKDRRPTEVVVPSKEPGSSSQSSPQWASGTLTPTSSLPSPALPPEESIIQPGISIPILDLPTPPDGTLRKTQWIPGGCYGEVYRGKLTPSNEEPVSVATKRIRKVHLSADAEEQENQARFEKMQRIRREVVAWLTARHDNILDFYNILDFDGFQIIDGEPMFVSPWFESGNLREYIKLHPELVEVKKLELLYDAAQGLSHLRSLERPIIHGDIKPDDVMVINGIRGVKLGAPFGALHRSSREESDNRFPHAGTPSFPSFSTTFSQPSQPPVIGFADSPPQGDHATIPEEAPTTISDGGDTLSPFASINEKYSIVQPGVLLTELQHELPGEIIKPARPVMRGGYADVYRGQWIPPDGGETKDVAIKVLRVAIPSSMTTDKEILRKKIDIHMKRETLIWTRAKHPNIHTFLGFKWSDEPQLISPWCAQGNLREYLTFNPSLSRARKLSLIAQAALGLEYLHGQTPPICHGDIKPENILINDSGEAALSDFGVSRVLESLAEHTGLTTSEGSTNGTYPYTAPEVFNPTLLGEGNLVPKPSRESDVYAFGGLILAVMSGKPPFHKIKLKHFLMMKILVGETPKPKDHDLLAENDPLWVVMNSCWNFNPSDRLSMNDMLEKIKEIALDEG